MTLVPRVCLVAESSIRDALIATVHFRDPLFPTFAHGPFRGVQRVTRYIGDALPRALQDWMGTSHPLRLRSRQRRGRHGCRLETGRRRGREGCGIHRGLVLKLQGRGGAGILPADFRLQ